jgi:hypothetical protein
MTTDDDDDDVSFKYLKHVLIKFLTSREYEVQFVMFVFLLWMYFTLNDLPQGDSRFISILVWWNQRDALFNHFIELRTSTEDEQVMLETCRGPEFLIKWIKSASCWFYYTDILWCTVNKRSLYYFILCLSTYVLSITSYTHLFFLSGCSFNTYVWSITH